ncbi:MAG: hypothetical protein OH319_01560 [Candidatus Parvarchaeota archaeon]|nr:hypothetical protein [Candidatus Jingweiarchaeum tengchongense]MCW1297742.1 hypothetical protein [Candidatus Jingweiarchaeum tengchongense]MCW1299752.1 hypothetical protein [Candidatus Jingweiarchaeum tengchongense]MCW1304277.1 hypothetical protein [Candidatus Jingweiarchaeum tengchongense]MCW1309584.1 hypothetical protein [Candidatus Jingweiarchaeum tengchongense]
MKKAQGLPINTIVLVLVGLLVAVVLVAMWVGGGGRLFGGLSSVVSGGTPAELSSATSLCQSYCNNLVAMSLSDITLVKNNDFCLKVFDFSKQNADYPVNDHCYSGETAWPGGTLKKADGNGANEVLAVRCSLRLADGKVCTSINVTCCNNPTSANCGCI